MQKQGFVIEAFQAKDFEGRDLAVVVAKGTWDLRGDELTPSDDPLPIAWVDEFEDPEEPVKSQVLYEADTAFSKPGTDVVVVGTAYAPNNQPTPAFKCRLQVGKFVRELLVQGPRRAIFQGTDEKPRPPKFSAPGPIKQLELSFKYAYGGSTKYAMPDGSDPVDLPCPTNPLGQGYVVQSFSELIDGLALPQIEFPDRPLLPEQLVQDIGAGDGVPLPAGLGFYGKAWVPRVDFLGVMPYEKDSVKEIMAKYGKMQKDQEVPAPLIGFEPPVMQVDFYSAAAPYNVVKPYLNGNETVIMNNMTPSGETGFNLPGKVPLITLDHGEGPLLVEVVMDTLVFSPDKNRVITVFRGHRVISDPKAAERIADMPLSAEIVSLSDYQQKIK